MTRYITLLSCACLILFAACQTSRPPPVEKEDVIIGIGSINGARVTARGKPTIFSQLVLRFNKGEQVKILELITIANPKADEPHKWLRVQVPTDCGLWVHSDDLGLATSVDGVDAAMTKANLTNVRGGAGEQFPVLSKLPRSSQLRVTGLSKGKWSEVLAPHNASVYVPVRFVRIRTVKDSVTLAIQALRTRQVPPSIFDQTNPNHQAIETAVRAALQKPEVSLSPDDLSEITVLHLAHKELTDVNPLKKLEALEFLDVSGNYIRDFRPITELNHLSVLKVCNSHINKPAHLAELKQLKSLWLGENNLTDISNLANLKKLENLWLYNNKITDLTPLMNLKGLRILALNGNVGLSKADILELKKALPKCSIISDHGVFE